MTTPTAPAGRMTAEDEFAARCRQLASDIRNGFAGMNETQGRSLMLSKSEADIILAALSRPTEEGS